MMELQLASKNLSGRKLTTAKPLLDGYDWPVKAKIEGCVGVLEKEVVMFGYALNLYPLKANKG